MTLLSSFFQCFNGSFFDAEEESRKVILEDFFKLLCIFFDGEEKKTQKIKNILKMATWILLITNMVLFFTTTCLCSNDLYEKERVPLDLDNVLKVDLHTEPEYQSKVSKF